MPAQLRGLDPLRRELYHHFDAMLRATVTVGFTKWERNHERVSYTSLETRRVIQFLSLRLRFA